MTENKMGWRGRVALGIWVGALLSGLYALNAHRLSAGPGAPARTLRAEPAERPRLVMFVHPRCPCTPASLRAFERARAELGCAGVIYVAAPDPTATPNGRVASQVAETRVHADPDGTAAGQFGARTSGHAFLYAADGRLIFSGGLTPGRGRDGDVTFLRALAPGPHTQPVFGCPLH